MNSFTREHVQVVSSDSLGQTALMKLEQNQSELVQHQTGGGSLLSGRCWRQRSRKPSERRDEQRQHGNGPANPLNVQIKTHPKQKRIVINLCRLFSFTEWISWNINVLKSAAAADGKSNKLTPTDPPGRCLTPSGGHRTYPIMFPSGSCFIWWPLTPPLANTSLTQRVHPNS